MGHAVSVRLDQGELGVCERGQRSKISLTAQVLKVVWVDELRGLLLRLFAQRAALLEVLEREDGKVHEDQDDVRGAPRVCVKAADANFLVYLGEVPESLSQQDQKVDGVQEDEHDEVLVVSVAEAVVDERAVVVEVLDALVANCAVERSLRLDDFAVRAQVIQVQADVQSVFYQLLVVVNWLEVPRTQSDSQSEERNVDGQQSKSSPVEDNMEAVEEDFGCSVNALA